MAKLLVRVAGSCKPRELSAAHVIEAAKQIETQGYRPNTLNAKGATLRRILRYLWTNHGSAKLDDQVPRYATQRPRNVTASRDEAEALLKAVPSYVRLWLLMCSDLAMRSGTAMRIGPEHYDQAAQKLRTKTKFGANLVLPVTEEIARILDTCDMDSDEPFVVQVWRAHLKSQPPRAGKPTKFRYETLRRKVAEARIKLGLKRIVPHDLRRSTAVAVLEYTHDLRDVQALLGHRSLQATLWYLDHDLRPVKRSTLEIIKRPAWAERKQA